MPVALLPGCQTIRQHEGIIRPGVVAKPQSNGQGRSLLSIFARDWRRSLPPVRGPPCRKTTKGDLLSEIDKTKAFTYPPKKYPGWRKYALEEQVHHRRFYKMLKLLKKWKDEFLTCHVPLDTFDHIYFSRWVRDIRLAERKGMLSDWQQELLNDAEFQWEPNPEEEEWYKMFHNGVRRYYQLTGYTGNIPEDFVNPEYPELEAAGPWLKEQREQFWWQSEPNLMNPGIKTQLLLRYNVPLKSLHGRAFLYAQQNPDKYLLKGMKSVERVIKRRITPAKLRQLIEADPYAKFKREQYIKMIKGEA